MWLVLLPDDYRIADIILLMLLTQGQGHGLKNSVMFTSKFCAKFLSFACISKSFDLRLLMCDLYYCWMIAE